MRIASGNFTPNHQRLIALLDELSLTVFQSGQFFWNREDEGLYSRMRGVLLRERERLESDETLDGKT